MPGERIGIDDDGRVTINDQPINEDYLNPARNQSAVSRWLQVRSDYKQLKEDRYFVMGDSRDFSNDSRSWGPVSRNLIYGKYLMRYWIGGG